MRARSESTERLLTRTLDLGVLGITLAQAMELLLLPWRHLPDDAYFYLQIANSLADGRGPTFFEGLPTNGFHPFWMLICWLLAASTPNDDLLIRMCGALTALMNVATVLTLRIELARHFGRASAAIGVLIGAPYVFFMGYGLESNLAALLLVLLLTATLRYVDRPRPAAFMGCAALAGLCVFARLDLALAIAPVVLFAAWVWALRSGEGLRLGQLAGAVGLGVAPVASWLLFNWVSFGDPVPISGRLKMASAAASASSATTLNGIHVLYLGITTLGAMFLILVSRRSVDRLAACAGLGQVLFVAYVLFWNRLEAFAWYFVPLAIVSAVIISAALHTLPHPNLSTTSSRVLASFSVLAVIAASGALLSRYGLKGYGPGLRTRADAPRTQASLGPVARRNGVQRVLTFDRPGQLAFLDKLEVIPADGLTTNWKFQNELRQKGIDWLIEAYRIDAFVAPHFDRADPSLCGKEYFHATRLICGEHVPNQFSRVDFFSRLDGEPIGSLDLARLSRLNFTPHRGLDVYVLK